VRRSRPAVIEGDAPGGSQHPAAERLTVGHVWLVERTVAPWRAVVIGENHAPCLAFASRPRVGFIERERRDAPPPPPPPPPQCSRAASNSAFIRGRRELRTGGLSSSPDRACRPAVDLRRFGFRCRDAVAAGILTRSEFERRQIQISLLLLAHHQGDLAHGSRPCGEGNAAAPPTSPAG